jgi:hypothetical protein
MTFEPFATWIDLELLARAASRGPVAGSSTRFTSCYSSPETI